MAKIAFTASRVAGFECPPDKKQAFLWDATTPGLGLRKTPAGKPAYVFQAVYQGKDIRITIGSPEAWPIPAAQAKARELQRQIDEGQDPRNVKRDAIAAAEAKQQQAKLHAATVGEAWDAYLTDRKPFWGDRHFADHLTLATPGGEAPKNGRKGLTQSGPLYSLMSLKLAELTPAMIEKWASEQSKARPTVARLAWRILKAFLNWCMEHAEYGKLLDGNAAKTKKTRETLGKPQAKKDALQREMLAPWFDAVGKLPLPAVSAYLQFQLLTGCRPNEGIALKWEDVNLKWQGVTLRDKIEGERTIPLPAYLVQVLEALPCRGAYVFASPIKEGQHISRPGPALHEACRVAGIEPLTPHGLRRSFKSLSEWLDMPAGVVAQIMGHKPSATAEKHYTVRPLDLLRAHHEKLVAWILEQAGVTFDAQSETGKLQLAANG